MRKKILTFIFNLMLLVVVTEGTSRFLLLKYLTRFNDDPNLLNCSSRWRLHWVKTHLEKEDTDSQGITEAFSFDIYDKTKGWNVKPDVKNYRYWNGTTLNTNSKGLRGLKEYTYTKSPDKKRILFIGDSYTFGETNNDNEIFSYYLNEMMPNVEILNLGVHGYGHDQILLRLKEEGVKYKPDIVILFFVEENMKRSTLTFRDYAKPRYILKRGSLVLKNVSVPSPAEIIKKQRFNIYFLDLLEMLGETIKGNLGIRGKEQVVLAKAIMEEMASTCKKTGSEFAIACRKADEKLVRGLAAANTTVLSLSPWCRFYPDALEEHWDAKGHKLVAKELYKKLLVEEMITPSDIKNK